MSKNKIGTIEAIFVVLSIVIAHSILSLPRTLITVTSSASLLNLLYITLIVTGFSYLIYRLIKNFGNADILDISEFLGGKVLKNIIGAIFIFEFIFCSSVLLRNFCEGLKIVYFPLTEVLFIVLLFIITICITNSFEFNSTIKSNLIILPVAFISIIVIFMANTRNFDIHKIFPILGNGFYETFVLGLINISAFEGIAFLYFLPPLLKKPEDFKKISLISGIITGIYLLLCISIILLIFPAFTTVNEPMALYSAARYISFGNFLQRLESIFLLVWITSFANFLSIACKVSMEIFKKITNIKHTKPLLSIFGLLILGISLLPRNVANSNFLETHVYTYVVLAITFVLGLGILIIANIKKRNNKN